MNDFIEAVIPCAFMLSLLVMTFGFVTVMRLIKQREQAALAEFGLFGSKPTPSGKTAVLTRLADETGLGARGETKGSAKHRSPLTQMVMHGHLERAKNYKMQIDQLIGQATPGKKSRLDNLTAQVEAWVEAIEQLAQRVAYFQQDPLIRDDRERVPEAIAALEKRLAAEADGPTRTELERTLSNYQKQLASLVQLQGIVKRADIQIESTLSALGTIYSQVLASQSTSHMADYSALSAEVDEEVRRLQDQLEALHEVKFGHSSI